MRTPPILLSILFLTLATAFLSPAPVSAQTLTSTESLILKLQQQVIQLQSQIEELRSQVSSTKTELELVKTELKFTKALRLGTRGEEVTQLQEFLKQFPDIYPQGLVTGYFGPLTEAAVRKFQSKQGIDSIGVVGPRTLSKLNELVTEGAGKSEVIPPGLLIAPGLQGRIGTTTFPLATTTPTLASREVGAPTASVWAATTTTTSGTTPATPATPAISATPATPTVTSATPATPATPAQTAATATSTIDTTPPTISNIQVSSITETSATITWTTNESASSEIKYSAVSPANNATTSVSDASNVTSHSINLTGLSSASTYYYVVISRDGSGNVATSNEQTFTTLTPPPPPPPPPTSSNYIDLASLLPLRPWDVIMSGSDYIVTLGDDTSHTGRLIRVTPEGNISTIASFNKRIFGVILSGSDFIVSDDGTNILRVSNNGTVTTIASGVTVSNYQSDIALSVSDYIVTDYPNGRLLRVTPGGVTSVIASGLRNISGVIVDNADFVVTANATTPTGTGNATLYRVTQGGSVSVITEFSSSSSLLGITKIGSYYYINDSNNLVRVATDGTKSTPTWISGGGQVISITNNGSDIIAINFSLTRILKITPVLTQSQAKNLSAISQMLNSLDEIIKQLSKILK